MEALAFMAPNPEHSNWRIIAEQVTVEMDSQKLSALINQLCAALEAEAKRKRPTGPITVRSTSNSNNNHC
jgi:hypothetical protein